MYGLPKDLNLEFLCGQMLVQVCIGGNDLILNFHDQVSVLVTSLITCVGPDGSEHECDNFPKAAPHLMLFLNQTITEVEGSEDGTLRLVFDKGDTLIIYDNSAQYESYTIRHGERLIVV